AHRRAEPLRGDAAVDLARDRGGWQAPERRGGMRVGVIADGVAALEDGADELRPLARQRSLHEKRRFRVERIEHLQRVIGRPVVDGQPHFVAFGCKTGDHRPEPLRVRNERAVYQQCGDDHENDDDDDDADHWMRWRSHMMTKATAFSAITPKYA